MHAPSAPSIETATKSPPPNWKVGVVAGALLALALLLLFNTWRSGRPQSLPNATTEKLECASYTPSHNGHLLDVATQRALVAVDLKLLAERFRCVRTYSVSEGLDRVPSVARELGLKVMMGLWISSDAPSNDREIARGIALANEYSDVVTAVVVGNEVLLRREQTAEQLRALIERVRAATHVPVTYADVWEFWLRNAALARSTNFITIHILPYWEDNPIDIDRALDHVQNIFRKVQAAFPKQRVFIGETGWPSAGRPRLNATPSLTNEARFVREFVEYAEREKIPYNIIEAFDQPWKRSQEGTVGGYWGLYDAQGLEKFSFAGPVIANASWRIAALTALFGAALFGCGAYFLRPRPSPRAIALLAIAGHAAGSLSYTQWTYMSTSNLGTLDWIATSAWALTGWCAWIAVSLAIARWVDGASLPRPIGIATILHRIGYGADRSAQSFDGIARTLGLTRVLVLFGIAYVCLGLSYAGRGRDFPIALMAAPAIGFALLEWATLLECPMISRRVITTSESFDREEALLASIVSIAAVYIAFHETWLNTRALIWCGLCALFAVSTAVGQWRMRIASNPHQRAEQQTGTTQVERI